jgi:hypothetical protein
MNLLKLALISTTLLAVSSTSAFAGQENNNQTNRHGDDNSYTSSPGSNHMGQGQESHNNIQTNVKTGENHLNNNTHVGPNTNVTKVEGDTNHLQNNLHGGDQNTKVNNNTTVDNKVNNTAKTGDVRSNNTLRTGDTKTGDSNSAAQSTGNNTRTGDTTVNNGGTTVNTKNSTRVYGKTTAPGLGSVINYNNPGISLESSVCGVNTYRTQINAGNFNTSTSGGLDVLGFGFSLGNSSSNTKFTSEQIQFLRSEKVKSAVAMMMMLSQASLSVDHNGVTMLPGQVASNALLLMINYDNPKEVELITSTANILKNTPIKLVDCGYNTSAKEIVQQGFDQMRRSREAIDQNRYQRQEESTHYEKIQGGDGNENQNPNKN